MIGTESENRTSELEQSPTSHLTAPHTDEYSEAQRGDDFPRDTASPELRSLTSVLGPSVHQQLRTWQLSGGAPFLVQSRKEQPWGRESEGRPGHGSHLAHSVTGAPQGLGWDVRPPIWRAY